MTLPKIEKMMRAGTPQVGTPPFGQVHAHSTGNRASTVQNEADFAMSKNRNVGFYTHVVGNGRIIQVESTNRGAWDVGGGWNGWSYASVELIESHKTKNEFMRDYKIYVELLRKLAKEGNIKQKVDSGNLGILSHNYCTYHQPNNKSDHVDPYPYLAKWGISKAKFKKDVESGKVKAKGNKKYKKSSKPKKSSNQKIAEDGMAGHEWARRLQEIYNRKIVDGVISGQIKNPSNKNVYSAEWGKGGSIVIKKIQKELKKQGVYSGKIDGNIGPKCVDGMQRIAGTTNDGIISPVSNMIKWTQVQMNKDKRPF